MSRRNAEQLRRNALENAFNLLKTHPDFPAAQIQIMSQAKAIIDALSGQEPALASGARMDLSIRIFDVRSSGYLGLIRDLKFQEAYMTILGEFARKAWEHYIGYQFEMVPPYGLAGEAAWGRIQARLSHWTVESYKMLTSPGNPETNETRSDSETIASLKPGAIEVFVSYSHRDEALHDELAKHLRLLEREGIVQRWHDRRIIAGREFGTAIDAVLNRAGIILLLVSPDFVDSEYCWGKEMTRAMERHEAGDAQVIPIILRPVDWRSAPFGKLLALPTDAKPVTLWNNQDAAFLDIAKGIRAAAVVQP